MFCPQANIYYYKTIEAFNTGALTAILRLSQPVQLFENAMEHLYPRRWAM